MSPSVPSRLTLTSPRFRTSLRIAPAQVSCHDGTTESMLYRAYVIDKATGGVFALSLLQSTLSSNSGSELSHTYALTTATAGLTRGPRVILLEDVWGRCIDTREGGHRGEQAIHTGGGLYPRRV
ncbi:hypothetical protein BD310DRAFT_918325 [Dichomitus squalens]|uniref:Uncharacterized protein n=1 Tax=Dichomitus squalens TaxID=114155 RepID=A0A4V6MWW9_9APHY|nr:hypothetical protein BD310DRAFT_918325 [Dichomitus squalens]